jgi:hypothetical protein
VAQLVQRGKRAGSCDSRESGGLEQLQQIQCPGQRCDHPQLLAGIGEPFHRQLVPAQALDTLLGDERPARFPGDPLQRGPRVPGDGRVLHGQFRQSRRDLLILVRSASIVSWRGGAAAVRA